MKKLLNVFYNRWNFGDKTSTPIHYFDFPGFEKEATSLHLDNLKEYNLSDYYVIVGGGGILSMPDFRSSYEHLFNSHPKFTAAWGAGYHGVPRYDYDMNQVSKEAKFDSHETNFDLHSTRDICFLGQTNWVPCASSMFEGFDMEVTKKREIGAFLHAEMNPSLMTEFHKMDHLYNDPQVEWKDTLPHFEKIIRFFKESELIVTNSFHGMYWAVMAKVPVIALAFSTKFHHFRWNVPYATPENWKNFIDDTVIYQTALTEARSRNVEFYRQFMNATA